MKLSKLIWIDLEMTGLEPDQHHIVEIATLVTDTEFNILEEGPNLIIHQPLSILENSSPFAKQLHVQSGLWPKIPESKISCEKAEQETLDFLSKHLESGVSPMCGNTVSQDRRFLVKYMPKLANFFHYRHLDVTTLKIIYDLKVNLVKEFPKKNTHRAMDDIKESVYELQYYMKAMIKSSFDENIHKKTD